jgi:hypothetical protein
MPQGSLEIIGFNGELAVWINHDLRSWRLSPRKLCLLPRKKGADLSSSGRLVVGVGLMKVDV